VCELWAEVLAEAVVWLLWSRGRRRCWVGYFTGIPWVPISITVTLPANTLVLTGMGKNPYQTYAVWLFTAVPPVPVVGFNYNSLLLGVYN